MDNSTSLDLQIRVNRVYNLFPQVRIPLRIVKDERMIEMKGPRLRKILKVLRIPSSVLDVVAAARVLFSRRLLHKIVLYRRGGALGSSCDRSYERLWSYGGSSFALLCMVAWLSIRNLLHLAWFEVILLGFLPYMIFPTKNGKMNFLLFGRVSVWNSREVTKFRWDEIKYHKFSSHQATL